MPEICRIWAMSTEEELPVLGREHDPRLFQQVVAQYGAPAFIRRARQVEEALEYLLTQCRQVRDRWLVQVRIRLETLRLLAGDWQVLEPLLANADQVQLLAALQADLQPKLRIRIEPTTSQRKLRAALHRLIDSLERFERRWQEYLPTVDLSAVNAARDGYNRYYILEKECALRSPRLARLGFEPQPPLTHADLARLLPPLPVPAAAC